MPLYVLCPQCERVPVTKPGELCEGCQKAVDEQDERQAARDERTLEKLSRKPREVKRWLWKVTK